MTLNKRVPCVSGQFYPDDPGQLRKLIASFAGNKPQKSDCLGCILPHAGYPYSGKVAVETVQKINIKKTVVMLGPNHTGNGAAFSIMSSGTWLTPLGEVKIDSELARKFLNKCSILIDDIEAHYQEHSLEVELPILQYFSKDFKIVPIALMSDDLASLSKVAQDLASVILDSLIKSGNDGKESGNDISNVLFLASSDLTHYEQKKVAEKKDGLAIKAILDLDTRALADCVREFNVSMCGFAPVMVLLETLKILGAKKAELVKYQTSAESTGDATSVVGYGGIIIY